MTAYRKLIIIFYLVVVAVVVAIPILDGFGAIDLKEGTSWLVTQIISITAVPVAIAVLKTRDFFREDPHDVANLQREHSRTMSETEELHRKEISNLKFKHEEEKKKLKDEVQQWQRTALKNQNGPRVVQSRSKLLG